MRDWVAPPGKAGTLRLEQACFWEQLDFKAKNASGTLAL
jgi:hypothetical protein